MYLPEVFNNYLFRGFMEGMEGNQAISGEFEKLLTVVCNTRRDC
jgi:hypothetical protein